MGKTIYDVAREAGVSISTVSRVLNKSGYTSETTRQKVEAAARDYVPKSGFSRPFQKNYTIGLVVSHDPSYFFFNACYIEAMYGISTFARENSCDILLDLGHSADKTLALVKEKRVDALILMGAKSKNRLIDTLLNEDIPFVLIGDFLEESRSFCKIEINDFDMAREAVAHLINIGHRRIGYISGSPEYASCMNRYRGYRQALSDAGIEYRAQDVVSCDKPSEEMITQAAKKLLYERDRVSAILAFNDMMAVAVYKAAEELGLSVPADLSVIGFDDSEISRYVSPTLTTVWQPSYDKGYEAAKRIFARLCDGVNSESVLLKGVLIYRNSCASPKK